MKGVSKAARGNGTISQQFASVLELKIARIKINCFIWLNYLNIVQNLLSKSFEVIAMVDLFYF